MRGNKCEFTIDFSEFLKKYDNITMDVIPNRGKKGLLKVGAAVLADSVDEEPRAPKKTGHLRRSKIIEEPREFLLAVGFNTEYAGYVHEMPTDVDWSLPGSGPKFIEAKITKNKNKYIKKLADFIKE